MRMMQGAAALPAALLLAACGGEPPAAVTYDLILDAQGVVFAGDDGTYARFPFGSARGEVEQAAGTVYGQAAALRSGSLACGAKPMAFTSYGSIQLAFQQGRLVGWTMRRGAIAAVEGSIAPGVSRAQLERVTPIRMMPGAGHPGEFVYRTATGAIRGVLSGEGPRARIEALFAGTICRTKRRVNSKEET